MRYRLWFEYSKQHLVRNGKLLIEITEPRPVEQDLVTAVLLIPSLKRELQEAVVFGERKTWKDREGNPTGQFVRIDNHRCGRFILTTYRREDVLDRGSVPIEDRTDFQRIEITNADPDNVFRVYNERLASSDPRPFVLAEQDPML